MIKEFIIGFLKEFIEIQTLVLFQGAEHFKKQLHSKSKEKIYDKYDRYLILLMHGIRYLIAFKFFIFQY